MATKQEKAANEALLTHIRDRYDYLDDCWKEPREERSTDMRYLSGDPWDPGDRKARDDAGRPCISHDELNQYVIASTNGLRQNKRGIVVEPAEEGHNQNTAETRESLIRTIEYRSHGPRIYLQTFQACVEGGYGFFRVSRRWKPKSFVQEIRLGPIANPDSVLFDWDCKEPDWSDAVDCFVLEPLTRAEYKRRWPNAEIRDFTSDHRTEAPAWIQEEEILTAEYWQVESEPAILYGFDDGSTGYVKKPGKKVVQERDDEKKTLYQVWTNGIEILERTKQPGELLPIIPMIGLQRYESDANGSNAKRKIYSMVRFARDPQMSLAFLVSQQMEEAGLTPKSPYMGYVGQFETDEVAWKTAGKKPHAYLQIDPIVDSATGQVLPLPTRTPFTPNFQAYEVAKDSVRRAIQASMGISPLPTAAQRANQKSGVALERMEDQMQVGAYHFVDAHDGALELAGRVIDGLLATTYDTDRSESLRSRDGSSKVVQLLAMADPAIPDDAQASIGEDGHDITVSTGPSKRSQEEALEDFLNTIISNMDALPIAPPQKAKLLSLAIKLKNLGPLGDEMAEVISPADGNQSQQQIAQLQQQGAQMQQAMTELQGELQKLLLERAGKVIDNAAKKDIEKMKIEAQVGIAEIETKAQNEAERQAFVRDLWKQLVEHAHEVGLQAQDHANAVQQGRQDQEHALQQGQQSNANAMQQADQAHGNAIEQQQAAALQAQQQPENE